MKNLGNMQRDDESIAIGFKFVPTEEELIRFFLLRKAMGLPFLGFNPIVEKDLYGDKHPSDVLSDILDFPYWNTTADLKREMYVFTRLSKVSAGKTRIARTNTHGTWEGQTARRDISSSDGVLIGKRKMLSFEERKGSKQSSSDRWTMHEFSLDGVSLKYDLKYKDYVICKITRKVSSKKRSAVEGEDGSTLYWKKQKTTTFDHDHEPAADVDEGNKSMAVVLVSQHAQPYDHTDNSEDMLMLTNYTTALPEEYSHDDHTIDDIEFESTLKEMVDKELECTGNVDIVSSQECYHINDQLDHNISTKDSQLGNSLNNYEGVNGESMPVLCAQQSNDDDSETWSRLEEYLSLPDDEDEFLPDFDLLEDDGNGSSFPDGLSFSEFSMLYDRLYIQRQQKDF